jgi:hypothetical protein
MKKNQDLKIWINQTQIGSIKFMRTKCVIRKGVRTRKSSFEKIAKFGLIKNNWIYPNFYCAILP